MFRIKEEINETYGSIRYIKFSGDYDKFYGWKEKTKTIAGQKMILKYIKKSGKFPLKKMQKMMNIN